jgi:hypothetical protein
VLGLVTAGVDTFPCTRLVLVSKTAVAAEFAAIGQGQALAGLRAAFVLGESPDEKARQKAWASLLRTANLLSELRGPLFFLARPGSDTLDYDALIALAGPPRRERPSPWDRVRQEVSAGYCALVDALAAAAVDPLPVVGVDLPDARGRAGAVLAELAWDDERIAVLDDAVREGAEARVADGWKLFSLAELTASPEPLFAALRERGGLVP